ncbi:hypothetical protein RYX36_008922 [Vicia faba]
MSAKSSEVSVKAANKNMGIFQDKMISTSILSKPPSSNVAPNPTMALAQYLIPEGGYTNEFLYHSMCSMEDQLNTRMDNLSITILNEIRNSRHNQGEYVGEEMDEEEG